MTEPVNGFGAPDGPPPFEDGGEYGAPGPAGRVPPHDLAAETGVLSGILSQGEDVLAGMATVLSPSDFYDKRHALVYEAALAIYNQGRAGRRHHRGIPAERPGPFGQGRRPGFSHPSQRRHHFPPPGRPLRPAGSRQIPFAGIHRRGQTGHGRGLHPPGRP